jgi:amidase
VTLKPGHGVVPADIGADSWSGMAVNGALATTVTDLAVAHAVMAGEEPGPLPVPGRPLRIAVSTRSPMPGVRADGPSRAAIDTMVALLTEAGHIVVHKDPPITPAAAAGALSRWMIGAENDAEHLGFDRSALQPRSRTHARIGRMVKRMGLVRRRTAERFRERMVGFFDDVDLLLTPMTAGPPLAARPWHERSFAANIAANVRWAPWVPAWNLAGLPATSVPAGARPEGLPLAVQFVGPPGAEGRLLWLAGELERRQPWRRHAPVFDPTATAATAPA